MNYIQNSNKIATTASSYFHNNNNNWTRNGDCVSKWRTRMRLLHARLFETFDHFRWKIMAETLARINSRFRGLKLNVLRNSKMKCVRKRSLKAWKGEKRQNGRKRIIHSKRIVKPLTSAVKVLSALWKEDWRRYIRKI